MQAETEIRDFHGVYLLCSRSDLIQYVNRVYIGYTVNPNRRIGQHNRGSSHGGARRTSKKGPWTMVMIIHGFPNSIAALRFEWAWQKPRESRRLRSIAPIQRKASSESPFEYNFRILSEMLRIDPWTRLPLTVRWLCNDFVRDFPLGRTPPVHMDIAYGPVRIRTRSKPAEAALRDQLEIVRNTQLQLDCAVCTLPIGVANASVACLLEPCEAVCHMVCLASAWLEPGEFVPVHGACPRCGGDQQWGALIRKANGCADVVEASTSGDCWASAADESVAWSDVDEGEVEDDDGEDEEDDCGTF